MKKILTSIALLGMLVAGCTNIDDIPDNSTPDNPAATPEVATDYMAVSIMNTGGAGSKADAVYENGTAVENKVSGIRFYFFDAEKEPAPVKKNPDKTAAAGEDVYDSYYDYTPAGNEFGGPGNNTIEKTITLTLTLNTNSSQLPVYVVAVLNPSEAALVEDNPSMEELNGIDADFLPGAVNKDEDISGNDSYVGKFVMSNSAYVKDGEAVNYTKITKLCKTAEEALDPKNQTVIYVERAVARLDLTIGKTDTEGKLKPAAEDERYEGEDTENVFYTGNDYKLYNAAASEEAEPIYVKFIGWKVTSTPKKSNLLKQIDPQWPDNLFGEVGGTVKEPWNAANYFRSFWGMNPELAGAENKTQTGKTDYQFYSYNDIDWAFGKDGKAATVYIQENAAKEGTNAVWENHESKVIVAAQLVNKKGEAMPIVEYGFSYYEKNALLQYFADQIWLYSSEDKAEGTKLSVNDLEYKTQYEYKGDAGVKVPGGYFPPR